MKKRSSLKDDEMRAEYDFPSMSRGVRGKYSRGVPPGCRTRGSSRRTRAAAMATGSQVKSSA